MKRNLAFMALLIVLVMIPSAAKAKEALTLERCIAIALANHPELAEYNAQVKAKEGAAEQNAAQLRPTLSIASNIAEEKNNDYSSVNISVNQLLWDGNQSQKAIEASMAQKYAVSCQLERKRQEIVYLVKQAFFETLKAKKALDVANISMAYYEKNLKQAKSYHEAGLAAKSDVTSAQVDLSQAKMDLIEAQSNFKKAMANLQNVLGIQSPLSEMEIKDSVQGKELSSLLISNETKTITQVIENRPDIVAQKHYIEAAKHNLDLQARSNNISLSAYADYGLDLSGEDQEDYSLGVELSATLWDGGTLSGKIKEARGELESAIASYRSQVNSALLEIKTSLLELEEERHNVELTSLLVEQAKENLDLALGRYKAEVGSSLEVSKALKDYHEALKEHNEAIYNLRIAEAQLEYAAGLWKGANSK